MLSLNNISVGYKGLLAVQDVSFRINEGEIVSLIGSNGAGKSTIVKTIAGLLHPWKGEILFKNAPIHQTPPFDIVKSGISMIPEGRRLFGRLSVLDNLLLGAYAVQSKADVEKNLQSVFDLFPILKERQGQRSETFSGGEQQQLAIARGLMSNPSLLILDEPSLGLAPKLVSDIFGIVKDINARGVTVLLVEQNVYEALDICSRAYVLQTGRIVMEGKGQELLKSDHGSRGLPRYVIGGSDMNINMKYGKTGLPLDLPDDLDVTLIQKKAMPVLKDPEGAIKAAFANPVNAKALREEAKGCRSCCILICDITRPVPNGLILTPLIKELIEAGIAPDSITVLVATGLHRPNEGDELRELVGSDWVLDTVNVANHFARRDDDHEYLGTTSGGIEVRLDRRFVQADLRIVVGLVEPHFMAGYSGGRKIVAPGVAHEKTIRSFHCARVLEH